ncbi:MAG: hypothetical protein KJ723_08965 [candidate division Zixibacteria bacterium]|nr:hypothetical protein [candidate division Zixibacteria bacterium]
MKKAYILLIAVLVVVVLGFTYARSYLSRLESEDIRIKQRISQTQLMDSLRTTYQSMARETSAELQRRYDSLADESTVLIYALESQLNLILYPELDPIAGGDTADVGATNVSGNDTSATVESADIITPAEYEIYLTYLEKSVALPKDLSSYERKVAVRDIKNTLMRQFSVGDEDMAAILKKLRERPDRESEPG